MSLPIISITDHQLREYTHNIIVSFMSNYGTHKVHYCTYVDPGTPLAEIKLRLQATLALLASNDEYTNPHVEWTDDF